MHEGVVTGAELVMFDSDRVAHATEVRVISDSLWPKYEHAIIVHSCL